MGDTRRLKEQERRFWQALGLRAIARDEAAREARVAAKAKLKLGHATRPDLERAGVVAPKRIPDRLD